MSAPRFDTLKFSNKLTNAGFTEHQAEVLVEFQDEIINNNFNHLTTKNDLKDFATKDDLHELEIKLTNLINTSSWKMIGVFAALQALFHFIK